MAQHGTEQSRHRLRPNSYVTVVGSSALLALFVLSGCQKEKIENLSETQVAEVNVTPRVQAFVQKAVRGYSSREDGLVSVDSAEWYIEAALNYSFTNIAQTYENQIVDTLSISIPLMNGEVQEGPVGNAYQTLGEWINASNVEGTSHVAIVDVVARNTGTSLDLQAVYVVGSGYDRGVPNTTYGPNDYWWWMSLGSPNQCGCNSNPPAYGQCADKQIQSRINFAINGGYYQYWTNVESWWVDHWGYDDPSTQTIGLMSHPSPIGPDNLVSGDGIRDYPVYLNSGSGGCFDPTDMRFYTQGVWDLMQTIRTSYVSTKSAASCTILGDLVLGGGNERFQWVTYRYGKLAKVH